MTLFLIALAVGFVAAAGLWALERRTPPLPREQKPRPIADNLGQVIALVILLSITGHGFCEAWTDFDRAIWIIHTASSEGLAVSTTARDLAAVAKSGAQDARLELVEGAAAMTLLLVALSIFAFRLIQAIRRHLAETSAKPEETHA